MPVIQLPKDTRFGDLGAGLGNLIGSAVTALKDREAQQGVAQIMEDSSISDADKGVQALKKFGDKGYSFYQQFVKSRVLDAQLKETLADVGLKQVKTALEGAKLPVAGKLAEGAVALQGAQTQATAAEAPLREAQAARLNALTGPEVAQTTAQTAQTQATTATEEALRTPRVAGALATATQGAEKTDEERMRNAATAQALLQEGIPVPPTVGRSVEAGAEQPPLAKPPDGGTTGRLDPILKSYETILPPDQLAQVRATYDANARSRDPKQRAKALDAAVDQANTLAAAQRKVEKPGALPADAAKVARSSAEYGTSMETFVNELARDPAKVGLLSGTALKAYLERYGVSPGDESLSKMFETQKQLIADQAKSGSVFMSAQTIKLAKDISPSVNRSPLSNLIAADAVADRQLASISTELDRFGKTAIDTTGLERAKGYWERIKKITGSIQSHVVTDENGRNERTVMYFLGNQVNPNSMKPLVKNDKTEYSIRDKGDGRKAVTGAELFALSPRLGNKDPAQILRELQ